MASQILYTTALDTSGNLIHVNDAEKCLDYFCPVCQRKFILRKSGRSGPGSRRPHFAHNELTPNCTPESVLHHSFKKRLIDLIERYRIDDGKLTLSWTCESCGIRNTGDLLGEIGSVEEEYSLESCRPDIALMDDQNRVVAVIEVVVTHSPDERALQFYRENGIVLIQINLSSDEDLLRVEQRVTRPDSVDYCMSPDCGNRDRYGIERKLICRAARCARCMSPIETYHVVLDGAFGTQETRGFTDQEIELVKSKRRNIRVAADRTTKKKYPQFVCVTCERRRSRYRRPRF